MVHDCVVIGQLIDSFGQALVNHQSGDMRLITIIIVLQVIKGELGGSTISKYSTGLFLVLLWCANIVLSSLVAYGIIPVSF